jgi:hypothetical protein
MPNLRSSRRAKARAPDPRNSAVRAVLIRSGNQCAFPDCTHPLVNERNQFIAQICHIEAAAPGGPRYNPSATNDERRRAANLMVLCYRHHVETDDVALFPTERLLEMKRSHEARFEASPFSPDPLVLEAIASEVAEYWARVDRANSQEHVVPELRIEIDANATSAQLIETLRRALDSLSVVHIELTRSSESLPEEIRAALFKAGYDPTAWDALIGYENPVHNRDWEWVNLGLPNHMGRIRVLLEQLELRVLEQDLAADPSNHALRQRLADKRTAFLDGARSWGVVD